MNSLMKDKVDDFLHNVSNEIKQGNIPETLLLAMILEEENKELKRYMILGWYLAQIQDETLLVHDYRKIKQLELD